MEKKRDPGEAGQWIFTKVNHPYADKTPRYLISPKKWPNWYIYMQDIAGHNVRGCPNDPGQQGHWIIEQKPVEGKQTYVIRCTH